MDFKVLVAEPDNEDWTAIANGIRRHRPDASILRVKDGEQAVRFLFHRGLLTDEPETPDLVVLSAAVFSEAVVDRVRQHPRTQGIPIIVVSGAGKTADLDPVLDEQRWPSGQEALEIVRTEKLERNVADAVLRLLSAMPSNSGPAGRVCAGAR